jgi:hypothetical protein
MTPKEKALLLIRRFYSIGAIECKQCALIAVDELINDFDAVSPFEEQRNKFWNDVKKHIEKL